MEEKDKKMLKEVLGQRLVPDEITLEAKEAFESFKERAEKKKRF